MTAPSPSNPPPKQWIRDIEDQNVAALSRAITLVESRCVRDRQQASQLFEAIPKRSVRSMRLGITGPPGAGKSTLIDTLGLWWVSQGKRVAVLAVDPTSERSGGSLLVDKTRMHKLSRCPEAFIRPCPSGMDQGGIHPSTWPSIQLLELAGYDIIIVESVGVGQLATRLARVVDHLTLVHIPGSGDEWQALKKGLTEHVHLFCVHKADDPQDPKVIKAMSALSQTASSGGVARPIIAVSSLTGYQISSLANTIEEHIQTQISTDALKAKRHTQDQQWFREQCLLLIRSSVENHPQIKAITNRRPCDHPLTAAHHATAQAITALTASLNTL